MTDRQMTTQEVADIVGLARTRTGLFITGTTPTATARLKYMFQRLNSHHVYIKDGKVYIRE